MTRSRLTVSIIGVLAVGAVAVFIARRGPGGTEVDLGVVSAQATFRSTVTASGEIVATRYADIGSSVMGKIVALPVREGDVVKAGQVLARVDAVPAQSDADSAAELVNALQSEARAASEQIKSAQSDLAAAVAHERDASQQLMRATTLTEQGLMPPAQLDAAKAAAASAIAQVAATRAAIDRATETQAAATGRIAQARAQARRANDTLQKTSIVSPIDGVVTRLRVREGEMVVIGLQNQPGTTLMTISDLGQIDAEVKVAEADVLRLALAQPATITLSAVPGRTFNGKVVEIGASALPITGATAAAREFKVVVRLDKPEAGLRPGLTCDTEIITSERANVLTVPLQSVVLRPDANGTDRTGVFLFKDGAAVFTPATTGVIGGLDIEIEGIDRGATVIIGPYQVLRTLQDGAAVKAAKGR
jgi:HlyD family secretion protein